MDDLENFLTNGTTSPEPEVDEAPEPETIGQPRDENGRFAAKETGVEPQPETDAEPVPPTGDKLPPETFKGLKEEREKRQALERELQALKDQIQQFQQPQEPPAPPPSVWEDENAWGGNLVNTAVSAATSQARLDMSEMLARQAHPDFGDVWQEMNQFLVQNPPLIEKFRAAPHPWDEAYKAFKNYKTMQDLGAVDVADLETKLREQIKAELAAQQPAPALPTSLADSQSARVSQTGAPQMLSLEDILKRS